MAERDRAFVFIGSSAEGLGVAHVLRDALKREAAVRLWTDEDVFPLGRPTLTSLLEEAARADFAVLVLTPDDTRGSCGTRCRATSQASPLPSTLATPRARASCAAL